MNTKTWTKTMIVTGVAAIVIGGFAPTAEATTIPIGGGSDAAPTSQIDEIVAMRKTQMAHDYVAHAAARARWAAHH